MEFLDDSKTFLEKRINDRPWPRRGRWREWGDGNDAWIVGRHEFLNYAAGARWHERVAGVSVQHHAAHVSLEVQTYKVAGMANLEVVEPLWNLDVPNHRETMAAAIHMSPDIVAAQGRPSTFGARKVAGFCPVLLSDMATQLRHLPRTNRAESTA